MFCFVWFFFFYCSFLQQQPPSCSRTFDLPDRKDVCTDMDNDDISSVGDSGITSIAHVDCSSPTSSLHAASQDAGEFLVIQPLHFLFCPMNHLHVHPLNRPKRFLWWKATSSFWLLHSVIHHTRRYWRSCWLCWASVRRVSSTPAAAATTTVAATTTTTVAVDRCWVAVPCRRGTGSCRRVASSKRTTALTTSKTPMSSR